MAHANAIAARDQLRKIQAHASNAASALSERYAPNVHANHAALKSSRQQPQQHQQQMTAEEDGKHQQQQRDREAERLQRKEREDRERKRRGDKPDSKKPVLPTAPDMIVDSHGVSYVTGHVLGQGGFARVYMATCPQGNEYAFKVIHKATVSSSKRNKSKLLAELKIHKSMKHKHIVRFLDQFEDEENVYFRLELCANGSMNDVVKRRGRYSEPESRYLMTQILTGCQHMHLNSVIHRDLKLGNIFLDASMNVKIGDFGLAALLNFPEERKKTVCGTPNYIAPEILYDQGDGHSFEVDIWSVGVILYTLLIGKPPFQTDNVQKIYEKIKRNEYEIPADSTISSHARELIAQILTPNPAERPTLIQIMDHPWFYAGAVPSSLPASACRKMPVLPYVSPEQSLKNFAQIKLEGEWNPHADDLIEEDDEDDEEYDDDEEEGNYADGGNGSNAQRGSHQQRASVSATRAADMRSRLREMEALEDQRAAVNREAERAIQPGSPISTLLKVGQQPLIRAPQQQQQQSHYQRDQRASSARRAASGLAKQLGALSVSRAASVSAHQLPQYPQQQNQQQMVQGGASKPSRAFDLAAERESTGPLPATNSSNGNGMLPPQRSAPSYQSGGEKVTEDRRELNHKTRLVAGMTAAQGSAVSLASVESGSTRRGAFHAGGGNHRVSQQHAYAQAQTQPKPAAFTELIVHRLSAALDAFEQNSMLSLHDAEGDNVPMLPVETQVNEDGTMRRCPPLPKAFVVSWLDASDKYGLGYALSNGSIGVHFRDSDSIVLAPSTQSFEYVAQNKRISTASTEPSPPIVMHRKSFAMPASDGDMEADAHDTAAAAQGQQQSLRHKAALQGMPPTVVNRMEILMSFTAEITERLCGGGHPLMQREDSLVKDLPFVYKWFRSHEAIIFQLSNDMLQYNFYDHMKIFLIDQGLTIAAIVPSEHIPGKQRLYTWTLAEFVSIALQDRSAREAAAFEEAERLGLDMPTIDMTTPRERRFVRRLMQKLKFCRDVLLATASSRTGVKSNATTTMESAREALKRTSSAMSLASTNSGRSIAAGR
ncbi:Pkinase-domain-containing protein [Tilletiaria anomala UBC 951]|uniref:Serine/threonine-protein kinase n=1 Tax=Tilletiaria anomala (strain ATCC 24038 / CBS 436.72 / UBC 951) TaxID=1037660 RepID=A0A066WG13_TILAU|nr:Pkinase-domain-containing protein [Tilletiaria anomala UBC 951]KDN52887.1 Pkinase-domain-containing protein [Tilletiaria anomala UBC 951]